eukprot:COSAG03_NODE_2042_length_3192_cov_1.691238_3_plen_425_part_00
MLLAPALALALTILQLSPKAVHSCSSDHDCSLNGVCTASACACDTPWAGKSCATLEFEPAPLGGMYGFGEPFATTSWGGNALEDGGLWHLFVTEIAGAGCGLHAWTHSSTVVHATAKLPEGPYMKQGLALPHQAHNPQAIKIGQFWYIFHIGSSVGEGEPAPCNEKSTSDGAGLRRTEESPARNGSTCHRALTPNGPWEPVVGVPGMNNPSPFLHTNGSLFLVGSRPFAMRVSPSGNPQGPWSAPIEMDPDAVGSIPGGHWEDPFLSIDSRGNFHIIAHIWGNAKPFPYNPISGHGFSADGYTWTWSTIEPYTNAVERVGGELQRFATLERPKFLYADPTQPPRPTHLTNGASPVWMSKVGGAMSCWPTCSNASDACAGCGWCSHCKQQWGGARKGNGHGPDLDWTYTLVRPLRDSKLRASVKA